MVTDPITLIEAYDFVGAATAVYTNVIGDWAFAIGLFIILGTIYIKTQDFTIPVIAAMVALPTLAISNTLLPPIVSSTASLFVTIALAAVLAKALKL